MLEWFRIVTDTQAIGVVTFDVLVFAALSAVLLIIKWMSLKCKTFLNGQSW